MFSSDSSEENLLIEPQQRVFRPRRFDCINDNDFLATYRIHRGLFNFILNEIGPFLESVNQLDPDHNLLPDQKLKIALNFFGKKILL